MMTPRTILAVAALAGACAGSPSGAPAAANPTPVPYGPASAAPAEARTDPRRPDAVRYGPSASRYRVHRRIRSQQALGDQTQTQDIGVRIYVAAAIIGPADSVGYPATFLVDSIIADSGTPPPIVDNVSKVRSLVFAGRIAARGEFVNVVPSDSALAQSVVQLLGNFHDFLPRLPVSGVKPGAAWTDTVETTQHGSGSEVSRQTITHTTAAGWESSGNVRSVRLESSQSYRVAGSGKNGGQAFELAGAGTGSGVGHIADDGRYLGGEWHDSTNVTIRLLEQGVAVPVIQLTQTSVVPLP